MSVIYLMGDEAANQIASKYVIPNEPMMEWSKLDYQQRCRYKNALEVLSEQLSDDGFFVRLNGRHLIIGNPSTPIVERPAYQKFSVEALDGVDDVQKIIDAYEALFDSFPSTR